MPVRKLSPVKERKMNYEPAYRAGRFSLMVLFYGIVLASIVACVFFIVYSAEAHGTNREPGEFLDPYEHDFGRMSISAYATMIAILFSILILMMYVTHLAHKHMA